MNIVEQIQNKERSIITEIRQDLDKYSNVLNNYSVVEDMSGVSAQFRKMLNNNVATIYEIRALSLVYKDLEYLEHIDMKAGIMYHINRVKTMYAILFVKGMSYFFNKYSNNVSTLYSYMDIINYVYDIYSYVFVYNKYKELESMQISQISKVKADIDNELNNKINSLSEYKQRGSIIKDNYLGFTSTFSYKYITNLNSQIDSTMRLCFNLEVNGKLKALVQYNNKTGEVIFNKCLWGNLINDVNKDIEYIVSNMNNCIDVMGYYELVCNYYRDISLIREMLKIKNSIKG